MSALTDKAVPFCEVFAVDGTALEAAVLPLDDDLQMVERVESFLRQYLPEPDASAALVNKIVDAINGERAITRVDHIASRFHLSRRTLERLFSQYVGVSPKWVIQRARLHEAADKLAQGEKVDLPRLALDLGYFDQAHFIKDFKTIIGTTPGDYARSVGMG
jgi:AraC-like DNA-binding protein